MNPIETAKKYFELSNQRKLEAIPSLLHEDATYSSDNTGLHYGVEAIMEMMTRFYANFPKLHWTIDAIDEIRPHIVEIDFILTATDSNGREITRSGIERIVISDSVIKHIEVRNK